MLVSKERLSSRILVIVTSVLLVFGTMATPFSGYTGKAHAATKEVGTWLELQQAIKDASSNDTIVITRDIVAKKSEKLEDASMTSDGSLLLRGKTLTIKGPEDKKVHIYRDKDGADFPLFEVRYNNNTLTLGENLVLSGKTGNCYETGTKEFKVIWTNGFDGAENTRQQHEEVLEAGAPINYQASGWRPYPNDDTYEFAGWKWKDWNGNEGETGKGGWNTGLTVPDDTYGTMTIVAKWTKKKSKVRIKLESGNGWNPNDIQEVDYGSSATFTRQGYCNWDGAGGTKYEFAGWRVPNANGQGYYTTNPDTDGWKVTDNATYDMAVVATYRPIKKYDARNSVGLRADSSKSGRNYKLRVGGNTPIVKFAGPNGTRELYAYHYSYGEGKAIGDDRPPDGSGSRYINLWYQSGSTGGTYGNDWYVQMKSDGSLEAVPVSNDMDLENYTKFQWQWSTSNAGTAVLVNKAYPDYYLHVNSDGTVDNTPHKVSSAVTSGSVPTPEPELPESWYVDKPRLLEPSDTNPDTYPTDAANWEKNEVSQGCDEDEGCATYTSGTADPTKQIYKISNGTETAPKAFFVNVHSGGKLVIDGATISDFITDKDVSNVAPIVVSGKDPTRDSTFEMKRGSIEHNSVGYQVANNTTPSNENVNTIENKVKNTWTRTNTAGAVILTDNATGTISGGEIKNNRADTGAIVVQGEGISNNVKTGGTYNKDHGKKSSLEFTGGKINNNVGVHYAGAVYVQNGGYVTMGVEGKANDPHMDHNTSWFKGGAVYVSDEVWGTTVFNRPNTTVQAAKSGFAMYGGTINDNMAISRAGAIEVMSDGVILFKGNLTNNTSRALGGAIYVEGDGIDRMYTLVIRKGYIHDNTAVGYVQNDKLGQTFKEATTPTGKTACDFVNDRGQGTAATPAKVYDNGSYNNYYGYGGGLWLCSFGGNATFNADNEFNVIIDGNHAAADTDHNKAKNSNEKGGTDIQVHVPKANSPNGLNVVSVGNNNFQSERNGKPLKGDTFYPGIQSIINTDEHTEESINDGVNITGNFASNGGGIAANGTVVFGKNSDVYVPMTKVRLTKTWAEGAEKHSAENPLNMQYYYNDGKGNRVKLDGFQVKFDGTADYTEGEEPDENVYTWEQIEEGNSFAEMAIPWVITLPNGDKVPTFTLKLDSAVQFTYKDANGEDQSFSGDTFDPSRGSDLAALWHGIKNEEFASSELKIGIWHLEVEETDESGNTILYTLPKGAVSDVSVVAGEMQSRGPKDKAGHELASVHLHPITFGFGTEVHNGEAPEEPKTEKYVNNKVHEDLKAFDEEITYSIMAWIPRDATEVIVTDTLVGALEFKNKTPQTVLESVEILSDNNHLGNGQGTVANNQVDGKDVRTRNAAIVARNGATDKAVITLSGNTVTLTLKTPFLKGDGDKEKGIFNDTGVPKDAQGLWVKMTYKAQYKKFGGDYSLEEVLKNDNGWLEGGDTRAVEEDKEKYIKEHAIVKYNGTDRYFMLLDGVYYRSAIDPNKYKGEAEETVEKWFDADQNYVPTIWDDLDEVNKNVIAKVDGLPVMYNGYVLQGANPHDGTKNQASYTVIGSRYGTSGSKNDTNIVTVTPPMTKLKVEKTWANIGNKAWPDDNPTVTFGIYQTKNGTTTEVKGTIDNNGKFTPGGTAQATITLNKDKTSQTVTGLPVLEGVKYAAYETKVNGKDVDNGVVNADATPIGATIAAGIVKISDLVEYIAKTTLGKDGDVELFKTTNSKPEIEKYVNKDVHADIVDFDKTFTYDIMAYVPAGSTKVILKDELKPQLKLDYTDKADAEAKIAATVKYHDNNNHNTGNNGTVAADGTSIVSGVKVTAALVANENKVEVEIDNAEGKLDGKWVQATIKAVIDPEDYDAVIAKLTGANPSTADPDLNWANISAAENAPVNSDKSHDGLLNKASYKVYVDQKGTSDYESNTVTIKPEPIEVKVTKKWEGDVETDRPDVEEFLKALSVVAVDKNGAELDPQPDCLTGFTPTTTNAKSDNEWMFTWGNLPKLEGVTYKVKEDTTKLPAGYTVNPASGTVDNNGTITNTRTENKKSIKVKKAWEGAKDNEKVAIEVQLYKTVDGTKSAVNGKKVTLDGKTDANEKTAWEYEWTNLPERENGKDITYSVDELNVPAGFTKTVDANSGNTEYTITNTKPEIEKYVDQAVHKDITIDKEFTYDILAYITKDADSAVISDEIEQYLKFSDEDVTVLDVGPENNHEVVYNVGGVKQDHGNVTETVALKAGDKVGDFTVTDITDKCAIDKGTAAANKLTVSINPANDYRGHWIKIQFKAAVDTDKYKTYKELEAAGAFIDISGSAMNDYDSPEDNQRAAPNTGNSPVKAGAGHNGIPNKASYEIKAGHKPDYKDTSNTVTVKPKTVKTKVEKKWKWANGSENWPYGLKVNFKVKYGSEAAGYQEEDIEVSSTGTKATRDFFEVENGTFEVTETGTPDGWTASAAVPTGEGANRVYTVTNTEGDHEPEIEKYVNQAVHKDITIDETFTYDIHAYVTKDAKKVVITDVLEPYLQFTSTRDGADWYVWDLGKNNNEKVKNDKDGKAIAANSDATVALARGASNGEDTVTGLGTNALRSITTVDENGVEKQKLTVTIENAANVGGRDVRGHWIKVRFDVKVNPRYTYDTLKDKFITIDPESPDAAEDRAEPNVANQPLDSVEKHTGLPNKASYSIDTAAKVNQYNDTSNTVTVKPEQVTTWVKKQWKNADGTPMTTWPTGKTVTFNVSYGSTAANTKTTTITVNSLDAVESEPFDKVKDGRFVVTEVSSTPGFTKDPAASGTGTKADPFTVTNREEPGTPEIEKYVNKAVHQDILIDQTFEYDIIAYVTKDADELEITDTLNKNLEFTDDAVTVLDLGANDNHFVVNNVDGTGAGTTNPTVAFTAQNDGVEDITEAEGVVIKKKDPLIGADKLLITIDPANDYRGHWIKVTFKAKVKAGKKVSDLAEDYQTIDPVAAESGRAEPNVGNAPVISDEGHEGVPNYAEYKINNNPNYKDKSNTVTIKPKQVSTKIEKKWIDANGKTSWPEGKTVTFKVEYGKAGDADPQTVTETLTKNGAVTVGPFDEVDGGVFTVTEIGTTEGWTADNNGVAELSEGVYTVTNRENKEKPEVEKYVNNKVHDEIKYFDKDFEYEVLAYVPKGAKRAVITDTLVSDLKFVGEKGGAKVVILTDKNPDHKVNGTVATGGTRNFAVQPSIAVSGQTITVTIDRDAIKSVNEEGAWVKLTFSAEIKDTSYAELLKKLKGESSTIKWSSNTDGKQATRGRAIGSENNWPVLDGDATHEGIHNKADFLVSFNDEGTFEHELDTNTVTVKPEYTKIYAQKAWEGDAPKGWSVDIVIKDALGDEKTSFNLNADNPRRSSEELPLLKNGYTVEERAGSGNPTSFTQISRTGEGTESDPYVFTNKENDARPTTVAFETSKSMKHNIAQAAGEYSFELYEKEAFDESAGKPRANAQPLQTKVNAADGSVNFDAIPFGVAGTFTYFIIEKNDGVDGVIYSPAVKKVTVETSKVGDDIVAEIDGTNVSSYTLDVGSFENSKEFPITITKQDLGGNELEGAEIKIYKGNDTSGVLADDDTAGNETAGKAHWKSTKSAHQLTLEPGTYTMEEVVAPKGYQRVTTKITFVVKADGTIDTDASTASVDNGGEIKYMNGKDIILMDAPNEQPEIEKYVNKKDASDRDETVHTDLSAFDEVYTYDIQAYITNDANYVKVTDQLKSVLKFVKADGSAATAADFTVVVKDGPANGTAPTLTSTEGVKALTLGTDYSMDKSDLANGKLVLEMGKGETDKDAPKLGADKNGKWLQITFNAKIKDEYRSIDKIKGVAGVWVSTDKNDPIDAPDKSGAQGTVITTHEGIVNDTEYDVRRFGIEDESEAIVKDTSNEVTVKPETTKLKVEKSWAPKDLAENETWPGDTTVTFGLYTKSGEQVKGTVAKKSGKFVYGDEGTNQATVVLDKDNQTITVEGLPKLEGVTYTAREIKVNNEYITKSYTGSGSEFASIIGETTKYIVKIIESSLEGEDAAVRAINSKPAIEKYVEKDVHADLAAFDKEFTYDILAYVPEGSTKVILKDDLKPQLKLNYTDKNDAEAKIAEAVEVVGATNNHNTGDGGTVAAAGEQIETGVTVTADLTNRPNKVKVEIENTNGRLDGQWVRVKIKAVINPDDYKDIVAFITKAEGAKPADELSWANIKKTENGTVNSDKAHEGLMNKASYEVFVGENGTSDIESNTVTVKPEPIEVKVTKKWEGDVTDDRPGVEAFKAALSVVAVDENGDELDPQPAFLTGIMPKTTNAKADKEWKFTWGKLPTLEGVSYKVKEDKSKLPEGYTVVPTDGTVDNDGTITNTRTENKKSLKVKKVWNGAKTTEQTAIEVQLMKSVGGAAAVAVSGEKITLDGKVDTKETTAWEYEWTNLPERENGQNVVYSVDEDEVPEGFYKTVEPNNNNTEYTITNSKPEIEKYVNKKDADDRDETVHTDLSAFDEVYTYDIQAYITNDANYVKVTDELKSVLKFVKADGSAATAADFTVVVKDGPANGTAPALTSEAGKKTLTLDEDYSINADALAGGNLVLEMGVENSKDAPKLDTALEKEVNGKWLQITFNAKIKDEYRSIDKIKGVEGVWVSIDKNDPIDAPDKSGAQGTVITTHEGIVNNTEYDVRRFGIENESEAIVNDTSNEVTVKPETTKLKVEKSWAPKDLEENETWPGDTTVTFGLYTKSGEQVKGTVTKKSGKFVYGDEGTGQATVVLDKNNQTITVEGLPKLEGVTYTAREIKVNDEEIANAYTGSGSEFASIIGSTTKYIVKIIENSLEGEDAAVRAINSKPAIEKYVEKDVHADLAAFDKEFTYDILAYVPEGSTKVILKDDLKPQLKLNYTDKNDAEAKIAEAVEVVGATNNHNTGDGGTVAAAGELIEEGVTVTVSLAERANNVNVEIENTGGRFDGQWVRVKIKAVINPDDYKDIVAFITEAKGAKDAKELNWANIKKTENGTVNSDKAHEGLMNKASYEVFVGEEGTSDIESNTVTVKPEPIEVKVTKKWEGDVTDDRPGVEAFKAALSVVAVDENGEELDPQPAFLTGITPTTTNAKSDNEWKFTWGKLPTLEGVSYKVKEDKSKLPAGYTVVPTDGTVDNNGTITNTRTENKKSLKVKKVWAGTADREKFDIIVQLYKTVDGNKTAVTGEAITLDGKADAKETTPWEYQWTDLPERENGKAITYSVDEINTLPNGFYKTVEPNDNSTEYTITNSKPEIEKYVNKLDADDRDETVHTDLSAFDEVYTYDIQAYITKDANYVIVEDQLRSVLEFAKKDGNPATAENPVDASDFTVVVKDGPANGAAPTLTSEKGKQELALGTDYRISADDLAKEDNKLVLEMGTYSKDAKKLDTALDKEVNGKWLQITFNARIKNDFRSIQALVDAGEDVWVITDKNKPIDKPDASGKQGEEISGHEGIVNDSKYTVGRAGVTVGNLYTVEDQSNEVTVKPEMTKVKVTKKWMANNGEQNWPTGATVEVKLQSRSKTGEEWSDWQDIEGKTAILTADKQHHTFTDLPKLIGVEYRAKEGKVTGADNYSHGKAVEKDGEWTITNVIYTPEIEKYVNAESVKDEGREKQKQDGNVHTTIDNFDDVFVYDIQAWITPDAKNFEITDQLNNALEFVNIDGTAKSTDNPIDKTDFIVKVKDGVKEAGSVVEKGPKLSDDGVDPTTEYTIDETALSKNKLILTMGEADSQDNLPEAGKWIQIAFKAHIKPEYRSVESIKLAGGTVWETVDKDYVDNGRKQPNKGNDPIDDVKIDNVAGDDSHTGIVNETSYTVNKIRKAGIGNRWQYSDRSNVVTVEPKTTEVKVEKIWDRNGKKVDWPEGAKVTVQLKAKYTADDTNVEVVDKGKNITGQKLTMSDKKQTVTFTKLPKLKGVEYYVDEVKVENAGEFEYGSVEYQKDENGNLVATLTNRAEVPEFEKYINENVHEIVNLDQKFKYDVVAYVPRDADKLTITDSLNEQLQFAKDGANVKVYLMDDNNHMTSDKAEAEGDKASVTTGEDITEEILSFEDNTINAEGRDLKVEIVNVIDKDATQAEGKIIYVDGKDSLKKYRGKYIRVEFWAQFADDVDITKLNLTKVEGAGNDPLIVTEEQATHEGVENHAQLKAEVNNKGKYNAETNKVTVEPKKYPIKISKQDLGDDTKELPGAKIKVEGPAGFVEEWTSGKKPHELNVPEGKYKMTEVVAPENFRRVTTVIEFEVDKEGNITIITAAEEIDGGGMVELTSTDHLVLKDAPKPEVKVTKKALGGDELEGATMTVKGIKGTNTEGYSKTWTSTKKAEVLRLDPGEYIMTEDVEPKGYERVETNIRFKVNEDGTVEVISGDVQKNHGIVTPLSFDEGGNGLVLEDAPLPIVEKTVNTEGNIVVENRDEIFTYTIHTDVAYVPNEFFAVIDDVPDVLEIVDPRPANIHVSVKGTNIDRELTAAEKAKMIKITGNKLEVTPSKAQFQKWGPFQMEIAFNAKFRADADLTPYMSDGVNNFAIAIVDSIQVETPKDETSKAVVKPAEDNPDEPANWDAGGEPGKKGKNGKSSKTGDDNPIAMMLLLMMAAATAAGGVGVYRRRKNTIS